MDEAEHRHLWSDWMPQDKKVKYRYCLDPSCRQVQTHDVSRVG